MGSEMCIRDRVDWAKVEKDLSGRGVTLMLLWQEWRETHPDGMRASGFADRGLTESWGGVRFVGFGDATKIFAGSFLLRAAAVERWARESGECDPTAGLSGALPSRSRERRPIRRTRPRPHRPEAQG